MAEESDFQAFGLLKSPHSDSTQLRALGGGRNLKPLKLSILCCHPHITGQLAPFLHSQGVF